MSFTELGILFGEKRKKNQEDWEKLRWRWYYSIISQQGNKNFKRPEDLMKFPWELEQKKEPKKYTKEQLQEKADKAKKWLQTKTIQ